MKAFNDYAQYYDCLYQDKDYKQESNYIRDTILKYQPEAKTLLELGCGSGGHANVLAEHFDIQGLDISEQMIKMAQAKHQQSNIAFDVADIRDFKLDKSFDSVFSLFHVMSYQTTNEDFYAVLANVKQHIKKGGLFLFDVWYGPGVLADKPTGRVKRMHNDKIHVTRVATPRLDTTLNTVDVHYEVFVKDNKNHISSFDETHKMRYWFYPEITSFCKTLNFELLGAYDGFTTNPLTEQTWSAFFILRG